jgi:hypothetical protein
MSFPAADVIARSLGCSDSAVGRIRHAVLSTLFSLTWESGHCMVSLRQLVHDAHQLCLHRNAEVHLSPAEVIECIFDMSKRHYLALKSLDDPSKLFSLQELEYLSSSSRCVVFPTSLNDAEEVVASVIGKRCQHKQRDEIIDQSDAGVKSLKSRMNVIGRSGLLDELNVLEESLVRRQRELHCLMKKAKKAKVENDRVVESMISDDDLHQQQLSSLAVYEIPTYLESNINLVIESINQLKSDISRHRSVLKLEDGEYYPWELRFPIGWDASGVEPSMNSNSEVEWDPVNSRKEQLSSALKQLGLEPRSLSSSSSSSHEELLQAGPKTREKMLELARSVQLKYGGKRLSLTQAQAVELAQQERLLLLSGGPGVGKTETVRAIVKVLQQVQSPS